MGKSRRKRRSRRRNEAGLSKKALWKEIRKEERKKAREKLAALRASKRSRLEARRAARRTKVTGCRAARERARSAARRSCERLEDKYIDAAIAFQGARAALLQEQKERRELRAIERSNKARKKDDRAKLAKAHERRSESDDEVRSNIPAELRPLFEKVKRGIKGSARKSRTEAFLAYVEEHPREVWESDDYEERAAREMEERSRRANPKKRRGKKRNPAHRKRKAPTKKAMDRALDRYERDHWGQVGRGQVEKMGVPSRSAVRGVLTKLGKLHSLRFRKGKQSFEIRTARGAFLVYDGRGRLAIATRRAPKIRGSRGTLGELTGIVYETKKGIDARPVLYDHDFEGRRPRLVATPAGLVIRGGSYRVTARGIVG